MKIKTLNVYVTSVNVKNAMIAVNVQVILSKDDYPQKYN